MKRVRTRPFLNNLYRDMRDRRLLVPALALILGLIAVPLALSSSSATPAAPAPAAAASSGSGHQAATSPAVLTQELGVTNYRKRLEQAKSKNPFRLHYTNQPRAARSGTRAAAGTSSTSADATVSASATTSPTASSTASTSSSQMPSASPSHTPTSTSPSKPPKPTAYVFRVDVAVGPPGDMMRREGVEQGRFLPGETKPMVAFVGASENMNHALFLISDDVSSVSGDGRCLEGRNDCRLLKLKVGDQAQLAYAPEGDRAYKLKLLGVELAPIRAKAGAKRGERASLSALVSGR